MSLSTPNQAIPGQAADLLADARFRDAIARQAGQAPDGGDAPSIAIHPGCQMLGHSLAHHDDPQAAVSQYFNVALQQYKTVRQIRALTTARAGEASRFLDFACGYGRLLRFLVRDIDANHIWAAEIQPEAVRHVGAAFNVHAILSPATPEDFNPGVKFDFIWVASLFSHLPEALFHRWLKKLVSLLSSDGILAFSTHDQALLPADAVMSDKGILYISSSENANLDHDIYGTTYVTETFVRRTIEQSAGEDRPWFRLPKALAHEQDVYVVAKSPDHDLSGLKQYRRGPWGWVDERYIDPEGRLYLRGWAASLDDGPLKDVTVRLGAMTQRIPVDKEREDVARVFADDRLARSGWSCHLDIGDQHDAFVEITATSEQGETTLLYAGTLTALPRKQPTPDNPTTQTVAEQHPLGRLRRLLERFGIRPKEH